MEAVRAKPARLPLSIAHTDTRKEQHSTLRHGVASLSTDVALRYVEHGAPTGLPVVLLHGVTDSWRSFERVLPHLPASIRAFALSQRGHGTSERPGSGYRSTDFAVDVAAFLDVLGIESAVIAGHSMGATNALRFAIDFPRRTRGLLCMGTFASYRGNAAIGELWASAIATLTDPVDPSFVLEFQRSTLARPVPQDFMDSAVRESLKLPASVWRSSFAGMLEDTCMTELGRIPAPVLLLWGERDALIPRMDQWFLLNAIRHSRLTVYRGAGHAPHWEEPDRFARDLAAFVEDCE
jgi:non-heme chloroperoxidase